jgi:hypothetical protein
MIIGLNLHDHKYNTLPIDALSSFSYYRQSFIF